MENKRRFLVAMCDLKRGKYRYLIEAGKDSALFSAKTKRDFTYKEACMRAARCLAIRKTDPGKNTFGIFVLERKGK